MEVSISVRKAGHGLKAYKALVGAPLKAGVQFIEHGQLPDESIIPDLKSAYKHGKKAFGIKDIPRPWAEMLEQTKEALIDPNVTPETLEGAYVLSKQYEEVRENFNMLVKNNLKKIVGKEKVNLTESKEFAFGFVGQLSDVAMDHQDVAVRKKAIEILGEIFKIEDQSKDVRIFVLTTLQNIIDKGDSPTFQTATDLKQDLESRDYAPTSAQLFRKTKYPCLPFMPDDSSLLDAAKEKLRAISKGAQPLPVSYFSYGYTDKRTIKGNFKVKGNFSSTKPADITSKQLQEATDAAERLAAPIIEKTGGRMKIKTEIGNKKIRTYESDVEIDGDFID